MSEPVNLAALKPIIQEVKKLARQYRQVTGKPLGITGEVGELAAAEILNLELSIARHPGYDAIGPDKRRIQIKSRCFLPRSKPGQRIGRIKLNHEFDTVLLVLMDENFEPLEMYEANRVDVERELTKPGSISRNERGALGVNKFKAISVKIWSHESIQNRTNQPVSFPDPVKITQALLSYANTLPIETLFPTVVPEAAKLVAENPYAFCIATCLDRGTKADIIWTIPYDMQKALGHLDPKRIYTMSLEALAELFKRLPRRPRYVNDAPRTVHDLTRIVIEECNGDAARIWMGKRASEVKRTFQSIHGVGPGIASMGLLLIEQAFPVRFPDRENMDIKPDTHTTRVLYRLGISESETPEAALDASRRMNPEFPGKVDGALWDIGRHWCHPTDPDCLACPLTRLCEKRL